MTVSFVYKYNVPSPQTTDIHTYTKENTMSQDTAYLLRMEMIKLAQQRASEKFHFDWNNASEKARINENAQFLTEVPQYPTTEQLLEEAKKLKGFVDGKE